METKLTSWTPIALKVAHLSICLLLVFTVNKDNQIKFCFLSKNVAVVNKQINCKQLISRAFYLSWGKKRWKLRFYTIYARYGAQTNIYSMTITVSMMKCNIIDKMHIAKLRNAAQNIRSFNHWTSKYKKLSKMLIMRVQGQCADRDIVFSVF